MKKLAITVISAIALSGCAADPQSPTRRDAAENPFKPAADKSGIVILRAEGINGAAMMDVLIDGKPIAQSSHSKSFLYQEVAPGKYTVTANAENVARLEVTARPGVPVYIRQSADVTVVSARTKLTLLNDDEGRRLSWGRN
jgi:membrane carboxypeptidase/penicillin-binding protein PbpC